VGWHAGNTQSPALHTRSPVANAFDPHVTAQRAWGPGKQDVTNAMPEARVGSTEQLLLTMVVGSCTLDVSENAVEVVDNIKSGVPAVVLVSVLAPETGTVLNG
jgi:hypothetical protein